MTVPTPLEVLVDDWRVVSARPREMETSVRRGTANSLLILPEKIALLVQLVELTLNRELLGLVIRIRIDLLL